MKNFTIAILALFLVIFTGATFRYKSRADNAELSLARNEAMQATGACGSQFVATVQNGDRLESYVAGERVSSNMVAEYFQEQMPDGSLGIYRHDGREKRLIVVRPKR